MPKAFVMVDVEVGHEREVCDAVRRVPGVQFVYEVTGEHDLIAFVHIEPYHEFAITVGNIRKIPGVRDTETELVLE